MSETCQKVVSDIVSSEILFWLSETQPWFNLELTAWLMNTACVTDLIMALRDSHRLFLQSFMSHGILASKDVRKLYEQACERFNGKVLHRYPCYFPKLCIRWLKCKYGSERNPKDICRQATCKHLFSTFNYNLLVLYNIYFGSLFLSKIASIKASRQLFRIWGYTAIKQYCHGCGPNERELVVIGRDLWYQSTGGVCQYDQHKDTATALTDKESHQWSNSSTVLRTGRLWQGITRNNRNNRNNSSTVLWTGRLWQGITEPIFRLSLNNLLLHWGFKDTMSDCYYCKIMYSVNYICSNILAAQMSHI